MIVARCETGFGYTEMSRNAVVEGNASLPVDVMDTVAKLVSAPSIEFALRPVTA